MEGRYTMTFPDYTIGVEAYEKVREVCPRYGKSVVVIGGRRGIEAAQEKLTKAVEGVGLEFTGFLLAGGETSYENIDKLREDRAVQEADMIFAVGGGKAIDTAKQVAHIQHKPFFTFPTVAGSCAAADSIATIYYEDGRFREYAYSNKPPVHVFLCTRMLAQAPVEYLLRGISDTMAKYYEAQIAARGRKVCHRDGMGLALSRMCLEPLYAYGEQAVADNRAHAATPAFEEAVLSIVMTSGLVSNFAAPQYNGHIAHTLFTELTNLSAGEQCHQHSGLAAYGILLLLLCDGQQEEFRRFFDFCQKIGLPTCRKDIGASEEDIHRVFQATEKHQDVKVMPYKITQDMLHEAAEKLEACQEK
ncbi:iron-containing alcohol dehydrogenase family protein [Selenomonas sp. WCA-380-WT-3B 3/]|uniref:Glycerol dehydrogenase n=1 Tax=Selenomonas montiformis TaxID=2652285 RepID=A0A6I2UUN2_9FIRM|nr:iron-containing alcohol dehydrogenase family protein [Selenomonas montiformis]MSV25863.1 iron-containing alcohol dehydrogenase family protein [Selenomonas montiformis]